MNTDDTIEWELPSFLLRTGEVDSVILEIRRIAREWDAKTSGMLLSAQLDSARERAQSRPYGRKGFRFSPNPGFAELMAAALAAVRQHARPRTLPRRATVERRFCAAQRA